MTLRKSLPIGDNLERRSQKDPRSFSFVTESPIYPFVLVSERRTVWGVGGLEQAWPGPDVSLPLPLRLTYLGLGHQCGSAITEWREGQAQLCFLVTLGKEYGYLRVGRSGEMSGCNGRKECCPYDLKMRVHSKTQNLAGLIKT